MTITVYDPHLGHGFMCLKSKHKEFTKEYGERILIQNQNLFTVMQSLAEWVNNDLNEQCLFEVE